MSRQSDRRRSRRLSAGLVTPAPTIIQRKKGITKKNTLRAINENVKRNVKSVANRFIKKNRIESGSDGDL